MLKRGYVVSGRSVPLAQREAWVARYHASRIHRAQAEAELAGRLGVPFADVVVYCPALSAMKEACVPVETRRGLEYLNDAGSEAFAEIGALQERYADLWRFYVFVPAHAVEHAASIAADLFGMRGELTANSPIRQ